MAIAQRRKYATFADWFFNRPITEEDEKRPQDLAMFRTVYGRFLKEDIIAAPVRVTNDIRVEPMGNIRTGQTALVANVPAFILDTNPFRRRIRFRNLNPAVQYFMGTSDAVTTSNGFLIDMEGNPSDELVLPYTGKVWVVASANTTIVWMEEY